MAIEINTKVSVGPTYGNKVGNLLLEDAKFFGRPNFAGEKNRFNETKRQFTVLIPNDVGENLRQAGWNVKTNIPTAEELQQFPDRTELSHLKVAVDPGSEVFIKMGDQLERHTESTYGVADRARVDYMDMELRAWEYDAEERPGQYSARLVSDVMTITPNLMQEKYGVL